MVMSLHGQALGPNPTLTSVHLWRESAAAPVICVTPNDRHPPDQPHHRRLFPRPERGYIQGTIAVS